MVEELRRIPFEEFSDNLTHIFERVLQDHEPVLVESEAGDLVEVKPVTPAKSRQPAFTPEDDESFLSAAGGCRCRCLSRRQLRMSPLFSSTG
jgi:hypothetical protein